MPKMKRNEQINRAKALIENRKYKYSRHFYQTAFRAMFGPLGA